MIKHTHINPELCGSAANDGNKGTKNDNIKQVKHIICFGPISLLTVGINIIAPMIRTNEVITDTIANCVVENAKPLYSDEVHANIGMTSLIMGSKFIESMDTAFEKWTPREKYTLEAV